MIEMSKFILPGILFLLTLISGFWQSLTGRPYNDVSFNIHKLNALSAIIQFWKMPWPVDSFALIVSLLVVAALCLIALFASGALMSTGKLNYAIMLTIHRVAPGALVLFCALALVGYYLGWLRYVQQDRRYALLFAPMWGIPPVELHTYRPRHPQFFHHPPVYRYGGSCFSCLHGDFPEAVRVHFDTPRPKLYCAMGISGSPRVLGEVVEIANNLEIQFVIATTTVLPELSGNCSGRVLLTLHVPAHLFNPLAGTAMPLPDAPGCLPPTQLDPQSSS